MNQEFIKLERLQHPNIIKMYEKLNYSETCKIKLF